MPLSEVDHKNIRNKLLDYLSRQDFSEKKLLQKVCDLRRRYPKTSRYFTYIPKNVTEVIEELKKEGFIDDERFAKRLLENLLHRKDGLMRIKEKMYRRLINQSVIEKVITAYIVSGAKQDHAQIINEVIKKSKRLQERFKKDRKKRMTIYGRLYAFIASKGYSPDEIRLILKSASLADSGHSTGLDEE